MGTDGDKHISCLPLWWLADCKLLLSAASQHHKRVLYQIPISQEKIKINSGSSLVAPWVKDPVFSHCGLGRCCGPGAIPGPRTPACHRCVCVGGFRVPKKFQKHIKLKYTFYRRHITYNLLWSWNHGNQGLSVYMCSSPWGSYEDLGLLKQPEPAAHDFQNYFRAIGIQIQEHQAPLPSRRAQEVKKEHLTILSSKEQNSSILVIKAIEGSWKFRTSQHLPPSPHFTFVLTSPN